MGDSRKTMDGYSTVRVRHELMYEECETASFPINSFIETVFMEFRGAYEVFYRGSTLLYNVTARMVDLNGQQGGAQMFINLKLHV